MLGVETIIRREYSEDTRHGKPKYIGGGTLGNREVKVYLSGYEGMDLMVEIEGASERYVLDFKHIVCAVAITMIKDGIFSQNDIIPQWDKILKIYEKGRQQDET